MVAAPRSKGASAARDLLRQMRKEWTAYLFLSPWFILFSVFTLFSVIFSFYLSFHEWNILEPQKPFVGLQNYIQLLHDSLFLESVGNTLYYTVLSVPLSMVLGLLIALMLNNQIRARGLFRTMYYVPVVTPLVVAAIIWKWVYNGDYGLLNYYLLKLHIIGHPIGWLSDPNLAMPSVVMVSVWKGVGFQMVVFLAGLQAIPQEFYDAAKVDGAGVFNRFRHVTIPLLAPTTFFVAVISVIGSFQVFTEIFIMTNGGPVNRTTTIVYYLYQTAFKEFDMGYASAMAYALFAIVFVFTLLQLRYFRRREVEY